MRSIEAKQGGFTLFEVLIYIGLFSFIMGGAMLGAYQMIESSTRTNTRSIIIEETNFLTRKIEWALGAGINISQFEIVEGVMEFDDEPLSSPAVTVSDFYVETDAGPPSEVSFSFKINGWQSATTTKYAR